MQESEKHLDKILSVDEFVRRIFTVMYSNDPVARALTLRTLGSISCVVKNRTNVHHSIRSSLDSNDTVELEAAIYACSRLSAVSPAFAASICPIVAQMMNNLSTPVDIKLKLFSVFSNMTHDAQTAYQVRELCLSLLPTHPAQDFVVEILDVLTKLTSTSVTHLTSQIIILLEHLETDPRASVRNQALSDLRFLAEGEKWAHLWTREHLERLVNYASKSHYMRLKCQAIRVLVLLSKSLAVHQMDLTATSPVLELCEKNIYHEDVRLAAVSTELMTQLAVHVCREKIANIDVMRNTCAGIENLLFLVSSSGPKEALSLALRCVLDLCRVDAALCSHFVDVLALFLPNKAICLTLCAIGAERRVLGHLEPKIREHLPKQPLILWTLLLQASLENSSAQLEFPLSSLSTELSDWDRYRLARQAAHYGQHRAVRLLVENLENSVSSEHLYFWLIALKNLALGEETRQTWYFAKAVSSLKAATTPMHSLHFQAEYVRLRMQLISLDQQLLHSSSCLRTCPPPAIAASLATASRDENMKCGRVVTQLRKSARDWRTLSEQYGALYESSFDADTPSLQHVRVLQQKCQIIAQAVEKVSQFNQGIGAQTTMVEPWSDLSPSSSTFRDYEAAQKALSLYQSLGDADGLTTSKVSTLVEISQLLVGVPLHVPRSFFQRLQTTNLQLAIGPQQTNPNEPVFIAGHQLSLKVEGVVQQSARVHRRVRSVKLKISANDPPSLSLEEVVEPKNDYFSAEFLVSLPTAGVYCIIIDTAVLDEARDVWTTGPKEVFMVKTHEDSTYKRLYLQRV
ncbi:integrator complex subunit 7 [Galendromus occidentalis]|uniref:Integrator complex subunit 7 n=1 Tax=Galendromus occidentalis TaxID=34638 RepID=A0AAJ7WJ58_9ACAR|nr:integrator complex subunit 7 [Galendromus occidentalis]